MNSVRPSSHFGPSFALAYGAYASQVQQLQQPQLPQQPVSDRLDLALRWMASFENWDLKTMYSYMTEAPDFVYEYLPSSFGMESKTRREWQSYNDRHKMILPDFRVCSIRIILGTSH